MAIGRAVLNQGIRPRMSSRCPPPVSALIQAMWSTDPNRRPSMSAVRLDPKLSRSFAFLNNSQIVLWIKFFAKKVGLSLHCPGDCLGITSH